MSLRDLLNQKEARLAEVRKNLVESNIDKNLIETIMTATTSSINEATDELEKAIQESEEATEKAEQSIKESEEAKEQAEKAIKEAEEALAEPMNESNKKVVGALVKLEMQNHMHSIKEMKNFEANKQAISALVESTIHLLNALGEDIITDANRALVESTNKRYEGLLNKHNSFVESSNKAIRESNLTISKIKAEQTAFKENAMRSISESIFKGATQGLTLIEQEKVKSLVENKSFSTPDEYTAKLNEAVNSLKNSNGEDKGLVNKPLNESKDFEKDKKTNITPNVTLTGSVF